MIKQTGRCSWTIDIDNTCKMSSGKRSDTKRKRLKMKVFTKEGPISSLEVRSHMAHSGDPPGEGKVLSLGLHTVGMIYLQGDGTSVVFSMPTRFSLGKKSEMLKQSRNTIPHTHSPEIQHVGGQARTPRSQTKLRRTRKAWQR